MKLNNGIRLTWLGHSTFKEAAYAAQLLKVPAILPIHYGTFPLLTGTPEELRKLTASQDAEIITLKVGDTLSL